MAVTAASAAVGDAASGVGSAVTEGDTEGDGWTAGVAAHAVQTIAAAATTAANIMERRAAVTQTA